MSLREHSATINQEGLNQFFFLQCLVKLSRCFFSGVPCFSFDPLIIPPLPIMEVFIRDEAILLCIPLLILLELILYVKYNINKVQNLSIAKMMMEIQDPSLVGDFIEVFSIQVFCTITNTLTSFEDQIMIRLFKQSSKSVYKIQLTSQENISFFYISYAVNSSYDDYLKGSNLKTKQISLSEWFKGFFQQNFSFAIQLINQVEAEFVVIANQVYKKQKLIGIKITRGDQKAMKESIMYRYELMKYRKEYLKDHWNKISQVVKTKNPSLLVQLQGKIKKSVFK